MTTPNTQGTDLVYIAACSRDARLTRICVASIRYFYPDIPIQILAGDILQPGLAEELKRLWNVDLADLPAGDYGWGLVKLEPLFGSPGQKFLVVDADTVFTGKVLERRAESSADFFVDNELLSDADFKRLYYDWEKLRDIDPEVQSARSSYNAGEWFGTSGLVCRGDFDRWVEWSMPRKLKYPDLFMGGDQGILNYVVLQKEAAGQVTIERSTLMRWPGHGMEDLTPADVATGVAPALIVHWAGMKSTFLSTTVGGDLLKFFEDYYYQKVQHGGILKILHLCRHVWIQESHKFLVPWKLRFRKWFCRAEKNKNAETKA